MSSEVPAPWAGLAPVGAYPYEETHDLRVGPDLHKALLPLLPLVGVWRGRGQGGYPTIEGFHYGQEIRFSHDGRPFLHYESRAWLIEPDGTPIRPMAYDEWDDDYRDSTRPGRVVDPGYDMIGDSPIAMICVQGTLVQKLGTLRPYSGMTGYDGLRESILRAHADPAVEAIVFDIDSPGGEVAGCFDLVDTVYGLRGDKPMWSILSESAYSAAYAFASLIRSGDQFDPPKARTSPARRCLLSRSTNCPTGTVGLSRCIR